MKLTPKTQRAKIILLILSVALLLVVAFAVFIVNNNRAVTNAPSVAQGDDVDTKEAEVAALKEAISTGSNSPVVQNDTSDSEVVVSEPVFSDTSSWVQKNSRDGTFSISYLQSSTYSACSDLEDNILVGMVLYSDTNAACGSVTDAITVQSDGNGSVRLLSETVIAQSDATFSRGDAAPVSVTLVGGQVAQRYIYITKQNDINYIVTEYRMLVNGKPYVALNAFQSDKVPNMSPLDFDTVIQKTLRFN